MKVRLLLIGIVLCVLIGCASTPVGVVIPSTTELHGFWDGMWHGLTAAISFICSLFMDDVEMYAINNTGTWYDFGFLIGISAFYGSSITVKLRD